MHAAEASNWKLTASLVLSVGEGVTLMVPFLTLTAFLMVAVWPSCLSAFAVAVLDCGALKLLHLCGM